LYIKISEFGFPHSLGYGTSSSGIQVASFKSKAKLAEEMKKLSSLTKIPKEKGSEKEMRDSDDEEEEQIAVDEDEEEDEEDEEEEADRKAPPKAKKAPPKAKKAPPKARRGRKDSSGSDAEWNPENEQKSQSQQRRERAENLRNKGNLEAAKRKTNFQKQVEGGSQKYLQMQSFLDTLNSFPDDRSDFDFG
jgi:hypothetical protein